MGKDNARGKPEHRNVHPLTFNVFLGGNKDNSDDDTHPTRIIVPAGKYSVAMKVKQKQSRMKKKKQKH